MPTFFSKLRSRWPSRKKSSASLVESDSGMPNLADSSRVSKEVRRLENRAGSASTAWRSTIEIRNSMSSTSGEENRASKIAAVPAITPPISNPPSTQLLAENTETQNSIKPSDSIESPPAIPPPIVNDPGRPLPLIKPESAPIAALTSVTSTGNSPTPSSTPDGETVATTTVAIKSSALWSQAVDKLEEEDRKSISGSRDDINLVKCFIGEIEKKQKECDKKRWFYTNSKGKNVFLLDGLVTQLNKYATIGDIALQHHPDVVALAWSGFRFLLQVGTAYTEDMQTASESLEYLLRVLFCCDIYEKLYCKTDLLIVQHLNTSLVELYVSILEYLCYIKRFLSKDTRARILASFVSELKGLLKNVQQKESTVLSDVDKAEKEASAIERTERREETERLKQQLEDIKEPLERIESAVITVYEAIAEDRRLKVLSWLSDIKFIDHHTFSRERRQEKTGQWLEENETYKEWKNSKSSSLLWLRGDAGYGKTILVSYIIDELQTQAKSNENILAYFYCNYKEDNRRRPETVLRTLVKQFCLKSPGDPNFVPLPVSSIYSQRERDGHASGELRCQESTDLIINLSRMYHQVTIIVDALDECYHETRRELFLSLKAIVKSGSNVKVFLASRFEQDIALMFEGYKCHYIQASDNTKDINNYIDLQLNIRCDRQNYGTEELLLDGEVDDALKKEISRTLKEKANGMFMWVNLQILALCEEPTASCVREALKRLPKDLKETYDRIIERTEIRQSGSRIAQSVLGWLLSAQEPCSLSTILQGLAVGPGENKFDPDILSLNLPRVLDCCKNLIVNDRNTQKLRFAHFSVQEYLLGNPKLKEGSIINHTTMAEICLKVLLYHHSESGSSQAEVEYYNLREYATKHWATHVRLSGSPPQSTLYGLCIKFLKPSTAYSLWVSAAKEEDDPFKVSNTTFVSPFWVACYYRLWDFFNVKTTSEKTLNEVNYCSWTPLLFAAEKGRDQLVKLLLQNSRTDVNCVSKSGRTPLLWAAEKGYDKVARLLLEDSRTDVNIADITEHGQTPLSWAAKKGYDKVVELLVGDSRTDVNIVDAEFGRAPLSWAVEKGHDKVVELLVGDSRTDVNVVDPVYGRTPLLLAILGEDRDKMVELFLRNSRIDVNIADTEHGRTPLSWVAKKGHDKVVELLLGDSRTDVNIVDAKYGRTPLSLAVEKGHDKVAELLLGDSRTDVNIVDYVYGRTPLAWAVEKYCNKTLKLLLVDSRTDVNIVDANYGRAPLSWAILREDRNKVVELFLRNSRTDVNIADRLGRTALSWAAGDGHNKVVELLLRDSRPLDVNIWDDTHGRTALSWAAGNGHNKVVELLLLDGRADVHISDKENRVPLLRAMQWGRVGVVERLVRDSRADVNIAMDDQFCRTSLLWALVGGHDTVAELLLQDSRTDFNIVDKLSWTPLLWALEKGNYRALELLLLDSRTDVNIVESKYGQTALAWAARRGRDKAVGLFLQNNRTDIDVNKADKLGQTPLSLAVRGGHHKVVQLLVRHRRINVNKADKLRRTPLSWAAEYGHGKVVEFLLRKSRIDVNRRDKLSRTPLSWAAGGGHDKVVQLLLGDSRTDVNMADKDNWTPLLWAAGRNLDRVVELLLRDSRIDVTIADKLGRTPLSWAAGGGHDKVVQLFLGDSRTDVNMADKYRYTPLIWAAECGCSKVVELLLGDSRIDVNKEAGKDKQTPLSWVAGKGFGEAVELLLQNSGTNVNIADMDGRTPLSLAAGIGNDNVVELLLRDSRTNVNRVSTTGRTALSMAAWGCHDKVVKMLLQDSRIADVNHRDNDGRTPLSLAAGDGEQSAVEQLLKDSRVDVDLADASGRTPLSWARENNHKNVERVLLSAAKKDSLASSTRIV